MVDRIIKPSFKRVDKRGIFLELVNGGSWGAVNWGNMTKGSLIGNHYHKETELFLFLLKGSAEVIIENIKNEQKQQFNLDSGSGVFFYPYESHAIKFLSDSEFIMLKTHYDKNDPDIFEHKVV